MGGGGVTELACCETPTSLNGQDLLSYHGQHLQVDAVELVKTGPGTTGEQTLTDRQTDRQTKAGMGHMVLMEGQVSLKLACNHHNFQQGARSTTPPNQWQGEMSHN